MLLGLQLLQAVLVGGTPALSHAPAEAKALLVGIWSLTRAVLWSLRQGLKSAVESAGKESTAPDGAAWRAAAERAR